MAGGMWCAWHFSAKGHLSGSGPPKERGERVRSQLLVPTLFIPDVLPPVSVSLPGSPALEQSGPSSLSISRRSLRPKPSICGRSGGDGMCRNCLWGDKSRRPIAAIATGGKKKRKENTAVVFGAELSGG